MQFSPWFEPQHILDTAAEWHALTIGLAIGLIIGLTIYFGRDAVVAGIYGWLSGIVTVTWFEGALVAFPTRGHAWYLVGPAASVGVIAAYLALKARKNPVE